MGSLSSARRELALALTLLLSAMPAAAGTINEIEANDTFATAQLIPLAAFTFDANPNIFNSTTIPHATILAIASESSSFDYYRFTTKKEGTITVDIDSEPTLTTIDTVIRLFDGTGSLLAQDDDNGGDPGEPDPGDLQEGDPRQPIGGFFNSRLTTAVLPKGDYVVLVGQFDPFGIDIIQAIDSGETYTLHVSAAGLKVPSPATLALIEVGFLSLAVGVWRRRR